MGEGKGPNCIMVNQHINQTTTKMVVPLCDSYFIPGGMGGARTGGLVGAGGEGGMCGGGGWGRGRQGLGGKGKGLD